MDHVVNSICEINIFTDDEQRYIKRFFESIPIDGQQVLNKNLECIEDVQEALKLLSNHGTILIMKLIRFRIIYRMILKRIIK